MPHVPDNYEALSDLDTITRAEEIMKDPARLARAGRAAEQQIEKLKAMKEKATPKTKRVFNNTVKRGR